MEKDNPQDTEACTSFDIRGSFSVAEIIHLPEIRVSGVEGERRLPAGSVVRVNATECLVATSRSFGGLAHRFAVFEGLSNEAIGGMYVHAAEELQIILFDLGAPEVRAMMKEVECTQSLRVLLQSDSGERRLMLPPYADGVDMLVAAARKPSVSLRRIAVSSASRMATST